MSLLADIIELFKGKVQDPSDKLVYARIDTVTGWPAYESARAQGLPPAQPGATYVRWFVQEMWLTIERDWLSHYQPLVYSSTKLQFGSETLELPATLGDIPIGEREGAPTLGNTLPLNYAMTPPLPFNGGTIELALALVGVRSRDGLGELVGSVGKLSNALLIPQLSAVVGFAGPIADLIATVTSDGKQQVKLAFHQSFTHNGEEHLAPGYYLIAATKDQATFDPTNYLVKDGRLAYTWDPNQLVRHFDYLLLRLETSSERDDLEGLTAIFDIVREAEAAADSDSLDRALSLIRAAKIAAWNSPDLTMADRKRVPRAIDSRFQDYLEMIGASGGGAALGEAPQDRGILERTRSISPEEALATPDAEVERLVFG